MPSIVQKAKYGSSRRDASSLRAACRKVAKASRVLRSSTQARPRLFPRMAALDAATLRSNHKSKPTARGLLPSMGRHRRIEVAAQLGEIFMARRAFTVRLPILLRNGLP